MRASTEKVSFFGGGWGERGGDGWPHLKHQKPKKLRKTCIRASDIESQTQLRIYAFFVSRFPSLSLSLLFFLVALRFSMRARGFFLIVV